MKKLILFISLENGKEIVEWYKSIISDLNSNYPYMIKCYPSNRESNQIFTERDFNVMRNGDNIYLFDWLLFSKNKLDILNIQKSNLNSQFICLLPFKKKYNENPTEKYPVDIQDAINNEYKIIYLDETEPKDNNQILVVNQDNYIISNEKFKQLLKSN